MPDWIENALIETLLMREFLVDADTRPDLEDSVWVGDVPCGPRQEGIDKLMAYQKHYGFPHVTTGNAGGSKSDPPPVGVTGMVCGVYVRETAYYDAPNFMREYLS